MNIVKECHIKYGNWTIPENFKIGEEVLIAFSKKNGHAYLIAGKYEVHGHFIFKKTFSRSFCEKSCEPLLYIRFGEISKEDILKIEKSIELNESIRESSCINYCLITIFNSLGILIDSKGKNIINLQDCLEASLENGAIRNNRETPIELFNTSNESLKDIIIHFNKLEQRFKWTHIISRILGKTFLFYRKEHRDYYSALYEKELSFESILT